MGVEYRQIAAVLAAFEQGDWDEIHLSSDGVELHLSVEASANAARTWDVSLPVEPSVTATSGVATEVPATRPVAAEMVAAGADTVPAPSPGIFWRAARPGAPPFAEVGDRVSAGDTLCIIELMKLMNHVAAPVAGTVVEAPVGNGQQVEQGDVLFRIRPDDA
ncbi:MAG: acetyl-CoA carboxylase, biotin carboxyl carrier protein [Frankiales bacterium]|nr:acetyl-CoA carboxylase, biotin carboxyl carrier protein [Frankiales bacterium]